MQQVSKDTGSYFKKNNSDVLFIAFSALQTGGDYYFEFGDKLGNSAYDVLFIRDTNNMWYQAGTNGVGSNIDEMAEYLNKAKQGYRRVIVVGASMGGYASLLMGPLLNADAAVVLSGQSFLDHENRLKYNDMRWMDIMANIHENCDKKYFDARKSLQKLQSISCTVHWFYGETVMLDRIHALRVAEFPSVKIYEMRGADHWAGWAMTNQGILQTVLEDVAQNKRLSCIDTRFITQVKD